MELDIIEIRVGNYFAFRNQVKQINEADLINFQTLLPQLQPLAITPQRLNRLNFTFNSGQHPVYQKLSNNIYFNFHPTKTAGLLLVLNNDIGLRHITKIHQLQNLFYDLTGDLLLRPKNEKEKLKSQKY